VTRAPRAAQITLGQVVLLNNTVCPKVAERRAEQMAETGLNTPMESLFLKLSGMALAFRESSTSPNVAFMVLRDEVYEIANHVAVYREAERAEERAELRERKRGGFRVPNIGC
jgi:hypothetical protein